MDIIIKMLFIMSLFVFNITVFAPIFNMTDDAKQKSAFMVLAGFNVLATTSIIYILHPYMSSTPQALAFAGFIGGAVIFVVSTLPYAKN